MPLRPEDFPADQSIDTGTRVQIEQHPHHKPLIPNPPSHTRRRAAVLCRPAAARPSALHMEEGEACEGCRLRALLGGGASGFSVFLLFLF